MAVEFNVTAAHRFFLGEDKVLDLTIFGQDGVTPLDIASIPLEWSLRKKDSSPDPPLLLKGITAGGVSTGITILGVFNADPDLNTQKVRISFADTDTDPVVTGALATPYTLKANVAYRHSLKRTDDANESILTYGSWTFLQATER